MDTIKQDLISRALNTHKKIFPCNGKDKLEECFTIEGRKLIFWFNTEDRNTHTISVRIN
ncbi:MAG: hypothetical protein JW881_07355 [Spirochaetales bacterium]|nr:hypothetical protein [Spirochaetales bacterium]